MRERTPAFTAAAERLDPSDRKQAERARKRRQEWQEKAWEFYDEIPEVRRAHTFVGKGMRELRLFIGYQPDPSQPPIHADPEDEQVIAAGLEEQATFAAQTLKRLESSAEGLEGIQESLGLNLSAVGEGTLHQRIDLDEPSGEFWQVLSTSQLVADQGSFKIKELGTTAGQQEARDVVDGDESLIRIWSRHPRISTWADSSMRPLLDICDELQISTLVVRGTLLSRAQGAGVWGLPDDVELPQRVDPDSGKEPLEFEDALLEAMTEPIDDPSSPAGVVPLIVKGPRESLEIMAKSWIRFARPTADIEAKQRDELIRRLAHGVDLPPEVVLGTSDSNHWNAWLSDENVWKHSFRPMARTIVDGLSRGLLWPEMRDAGFENPTALFVWFDPGGLVTRPDEFENYVRMRELGAVSNAALRRVGGASDADEPDDEELERQARIAGPSNNGGAPASPSTVEPNPPEQSARALVAAANTLDLGMRLAAIEQDIRGKLQAAADVAVGHMLDRAGALVVSRAQGNGDLRQSLEGVARRRICAVLGRDTVCEHFAAAEDELIDDEADDLAALFVALTLAGRAQSISLAELEAGLVTPEQIALAETEKASKATQAGGRFLAKQVVSQARSALFSAETAENTRKAVGETQAGLRVPPRAVRQAMRVAGGGVADPAEPLDKMTHTLTSGPDLQPMIENLGLERRGFRWVYGASTNSFFPHLVLDGGEFDSPNDPRLANGQGWPPVAFFHPDDHPGCDCDTAPIFVNRDETEPPALRRLPFEQVS